MYTFSKLKEAFDTHSYNTQLEFKCICDEKTNLWSAAAISLKGKYI